MSGFKGIFESIRTPPNLVGSAIISTAGAVVAQDWPGATSSGISGSTAARNVAFDSPLTLAINMFSTGARVPTTNSSGTTASSGLSILQPAFVGPPHVYRIPSSSTGYSVTSPTSGEVTISFWQEV